MPENRDRKYQNVIDYVEQEVGADINRDLMKVAIDEQDLDALIVRAPPGDSVSTSLSNVGGEEQTAGDWTILFQQIAELTNALVSDGDDSLRIDSPNPLDVTAKTVPTKEQEPVQIEDSRGSVVNPASDQLEDALKSNDSDQFLVRVTDTQGVEIEPLSDDVTASEGVDEVRTRLLGEDTSGSLQELNIVGLGDPIDLNEVGLATYISRALGSVAEDVIRTETVNQNKAKFQVNDDEVFSSEIWDIATGEVAKVKDFLVDGEVYNDGEIAIYGALSGDGIISGDGSITGRT